MDLRLNEIVLGFGHDSQYCQYQVVTGLIDSISPKTQPCPIYFFQCIYEFVRGKNFALNCLS